MAQAPIGKQFDSNSKDVENTVATGQGAITTGQAKNVSGHFVLPTQLTNNMQMLNAFHVANTEANGYTWGGMIPIRPRPPPSMRAPYPSYAPGAGNNTFQTSAALLRVKPEFDAIIMSINMGLPPDGGTVRRVRLQMFVRGPYAGLHRYVASTSDVALHNNTTKDAGRAYEYDMGIGMLDPISLYWRPPLFDANYPGLYYSFTRESNEIVRKLTEWNLMITNLPQFVDWGVHVHQVMFNRYVWQALAVGNGSFYPKPPWAPAHEDHVPWQLPIAGFELNNGIVRRYPSL